MKNKTYDILKSIALRYLPAIQFFILTVFKIWKLPYGVEIGATIAALATALGMLLGFSSNRYYNSLDTNEIIVDEEE